MACPIVMGSNIACRDSVGGIYEIILTEFTNVPQANITASSGVITAATCASGKRFFKYSLEKENAQFDEVQTQSVENGTSFCEQTLTFTIKQMSAALKNNLLTLAYNRLHIGIKDANGVYHWMGQKNGADLTEAAGSSGKAMGDMNGYTLTFVAKEPIFTNTFSETIYNSLQITA
jgi:hypothetical protein